MSLRSKIVAALCAAVVLLIGADHAWNRRTVTDIGPGIEPEKLARICRQGYTTKARGLGIGLHLAAAAARETGGEFTARSEGRGRSATFVLEFPLVARSRAARAA